MNTKSKLIIFACLLVLSINLISVAKSNLDADITGAMIDTNNVETEVIKESGKVFFMVLGALLLLVGATKVDFQNILPDVPQVNLLPQKTKTIDVMSSEEMMSFYEQRQEEMRKINEELEAIRKDFKN